jgi:hypothetical protein
MVPCLQRNNVVKCKWFYKMKFTSEGFSQQEGIDYTGTFAPVAKMNSFQIVLALAVNFGWEVH